MKRSIIKLLTLILLLIPISTFADDYPIGDVDGNGRVGSTDYVLVRKHILKQSTLTGNELTRADVNSDGKINSLDYILIRKTILGIPTPTPIAILVTDVSLNKNIISLINGTSDTLIATISPDNATNKNITWTSSNPSVATVENGKVEAKSKGTATITVTTIDGNKTSSCTVNVVEVKTFDQRNKAVIDYLSSPSANKAKNVYNSYGCGSKMSCDKPVDYTTNIAEKVNIYKYDTTNNTKKLITTVDSKYVYLYMIPKSTYYIESTSDPSKFELVSITGSLRMVNANLLNMRDLGGWKADGGTVKYGVLFRSANTNAISSLTRFNHLGITGVVDLRPDSEINSKSAIESIRKRISITYYSTGSNVRKATEMVMKSVVEENKNVLFNCNFGRDRTGTMAYILEGLLGVGLEDRKTDFELTYLFSPKRTRDDGSFKSLITQINKYSSTTYEQEKFINWYLSSSKDKEKDLKLINDFRKKAIDGNPHEYKLVNGKLTLVQ